MSVDLIQLGEDIGEAQATADAALEVAALDAIADAVDGASKTPEAAPHGCGEDCPCRTEAKELRAALLALDEKYNDDMAVVQEALDLLLSEGLEEAEDGEQGEGEAGEAIEVIDPEEAEKEDSNGGEPAGHQREPEGHTGAGEGGNEPGKAAAEKPEEKRGSSRHSRATSSRIGFRRGRR